MDWFWDNEMVGTVRDICPIRPSEYWQRQCFVGAAAASLDEQNLRHEIGVRNFMYGTDFPHSGSTWGVSKEFLRATFGAAGVPESEARAMLGENVVRLYGLDMTQLGAIAERVGPTTDEILSAADADDLATMPRYIRSKVARPVSN
jgi:hypothetical protein